MRGPLRITVLTAIAACAAGVLFAGQALGATMAGSVSTFEAIYGNPPGSATLPIGGGLGMNFGFGENMLFEAKEGVTNEEKLSITLPGPVVSTATDSLIGGTLMSNKTGANTPLSFGIQFADFQNNTVNGTAVPAYSDTWDRPWISEICSPASTTCKTDPLFTGPAGEVQINDVSFNIGVTGAATAVTVQGTVWGVWSNGSATVPPCIKLNLPPTGAATDQTLVVTKAGSESGETVGAKITAISGKACLVSANNDGPLTTITIANT